MNPSSLGDLSSSSFWFVAAEMYCSSHAWKIATARNSRQQAFRTHLDTSPFLLNVCQRKIPPITRPPVAQMAQLFITAQRNGNTCEIFMSKGLTFVICSSCRSGGLHRQEYSMGSRV